MRQTILRTQAGNWVIFLMVFVFIFALAGKIPAQEPPGWLAAGTGTYFEVTGSEYLNVALASDVEITVQLISIPNEITISLQGDIEAVSANLTLSGLESNHTYFMYEDGELIEEFTTNAAGEYSYTQDLFQGRHHIRIIEGPSTIYLYSSWVYPSSSPIDYNSSTNTFELTADVSDQISIKASGITLDGAGHTINPTYTGISLHNVSHVTIRNCDLTTGGTEWNKGISAYNANYCTIENVTVENFFWAILLQQSEHNTLTGIESLYNKYGLSLHDGSSFNTITECNVSFNTNTGIELMAFSDFVEHNTFTKNTVESNGLWNITMYYGIDGGINNSTFYLNNFIHSDPSSQVFTYYNDPELHWNYFYHESQGNYWSNYTGSDTNSDGIGDTNLPWNYDYFPFMYADPWLNDHDGDGIETWLDNCPLSANSGQEDEDLDGIGDVCDPITFVITEGGGPCLETGIQLLGENLEGEIVVLGPVVPTSATFEILNTTCSQYCTGSCDDYFEFFLNGVSLGTTLADPLLSCSCGPGVQTYEVDPDLVASAWNSSGDNTFRFVKYDMDDSNAFAWVRVHLENAGFVETNCVYDYFGGDCTEPDLCAAGFEWGGVDQSFTISSLNAAVLVVPFSNSELPEQIDISFLPDGEYTLCVSEFSGSNEECLEFLKQGEQSIVINGECVISDSEAPVISDTVAVPNPVSTDTPVLISAVADDSETGNSNITNAYFTFTVDGVVNTVPMVAAGDGLFDSVTEAVEADGIEFAESGSYEILVYAEDASGNLGVSDAITLVVDGDPPAVTGIMADPNPVEVNTTVTLSALIDDSLTGNLAITGAYLTIDGGDPISMDALVGDWDSSAESGFADLVFTAAGVYEVVVYGTDQVGNVGMSETLLLVVYEPEGGFVTGGGWILSPPGAFLEDPLLGGKANFGFVSKYKRGQSTPSGQTEFQFHAAGLNFHSSEYQWLVINQGGTNAQFKGSGTINGEGAYKFMIWAADENPDDTFRLRIWWEDGNENEWDVYDNGVDQPIGGGSIKIHSN